MRRQRGQTLIETIIALFILATALSAGTGLAIYALSASETTFDQIIAANLAREGVDVIRMMRDTIWLEGDHRGTNQYDLDVDCGSNPPNGQNAASEDIMDGKACYPTWLQAPGGVYHDYLITPTVEANLTNKRLGYGAQLLNETNWRYQEVIGGAMSFHLCLFAGDGSYRHDIFCDINANPQFARRVKITVSSDSGLYTPNNPELRVQSAVIWEGKNCPNIFRQDPITFVTPCKIIIEERLTNWKDYE